MRLEMRRIPHADQTPFASTLPRSLRRYEKRRERQYSRVLMLREYAQERAAEAAEWRELMLAELDYDDSVIYGDDDWRDYRDTDKHAYDARDDYYSDYDDWGDDYFPEPEWDTWDYPKAACACPQCRPDLYGEPQQHGDVTFYPLRQQPESLADLIAKRDRAIRDPIIKPQAPMTIGELLRKHAP